MHEQSLLRYHPLVGSQGEWHTCAKRDVVRTDYGAAVLDDHLYIVGGNSCSGSLDIVQRYSFASDRWEFATSMSTGLKSCTAGTAGDALVVVGEGRLEMFDVDEDRWSLDTDVPMTIYDEEYDYTYDFRSCFVVLW
ncbi:hypothetical protein EVAR_34124_1 [Eumeta japonica]|uniref:Uncharacterized protein n=1 Tax=Eumeta variegata TaxID=151549 RepID=A0A4C1WIV0_EUMVA|nr:hypothetical protein EVAR_34124_1 [Eumeta japonica]